MTTMKMTLAIKNESSNMNGFARLTFYKNPGNALAGLGMDIEEAGALDLPLSSAEAAGFKVGAIYLVSVVESVAPALVSGGESEGSSSVDPLKLS
jgi:hypothetical protein